MVAEEKNQNDPDKALATIRAKLKKQPGDAFLWYLRAAILSQKAPQPGSAEFDEGISSAKKAVTLQPSLQAAHDELAKFYLQSGQNALAIKECRLALQSDEHDQTALYHLVLALAENQGSGRNSRIAQASGKSSSAGHAGRGGAQSGQACPLIGQRRGETGVNLYWTIPANHNLKRDVHRPSGFQHHIRAVAFLINGHERARGDSGAICRICCPVSACIVYWFSLEQCVAIESGLRLGDCH
jgi:tetratricopeptide (TPR) repeat protein